MLINLLESNDAKCRLGALHILADISANSDIRKAIVDLDGIPPLIQILAEPPLDLKRMAAVTLSNVSKVRLGRKLVRRSGGIPKIVDLLDIKLE